VDDASDPKSIRAAKRAAALIERADAEVLRNLLSTPPGRAWMWRKLAALNVHHSGFDPDPNIHAFNAGQRNAGLLLQAEILSSCPDLYLLMLQERNAEDGRRPDRNPADPDDTTVAGGALDPAYADIYAERPTDAAEPA